MKILMQHIRTELYLSKTGDWTRDPEEARDFEHSQVLIDHARACNMKGVQIVVRFSDSEFDEVFPLPPQGEAHAVAAAA